MFGRPSVIDVDLEIKPHEGVGPVPLGATRERVSETLSSLPGALIQRSSRGPLDYYFSNALQVEYDSLGRACFMGVSWSPEIQVRFTLFGINPWSLPARELFDVLARADGGQHSFNSSEYLFRGLIVSLWNADSQYDHLGGETVPVYAQVGIGNSDYLRAIDELQ